MIEFSGINAAGRLNTANSSDRNIIDGLVTLLNCWQYGLAQEAVCIAEFECLAMTDSRDLDHINDTLKWYNTPFKYHSGNAIKVGTLTKVYNDSVELLDEDNNVVVIDSARRLVPFELYNAIYKLNELYNEVI